MPTVAAPVSWDAVEACAERRLPELFTFEPAGALERIGRLGDLHEPVLELVQELPDPGSA